MSARAARAAATAVLALALVRHDAAAQLRAGAAAGLSTSRLQVRDTAGAARATGVTGAVGLRATFGRVALEGAYRQGRVSPDSGTTVAQDLAEASLLAVVRPLPWLAVAAGPRLRAWVVPGATERWIFVEGRVRLELPVLGDAVRTHVSGWTALSASTNVAGATGGAARGGDAGIRVRYRSTPVWFGLAYAIDETTLGGRRETLEDITLSVGFGRD